MHASTCNCPKCHAARAPMFESESLPYGFGGSLAGELTEAEEVELAMELLAVSSGAEMDQFLGKIWKGIKKVGSFVGKRVLPTLGKALKAVAKTALPLVGGALGSFIPIPGVGTALGTALGSAVSKALELEYGELNPEEAEFEMARRFVRIAATAAQQAASAPASMDAEIAVNEALVSAARRHVPNIDLSKLKPYSAGTGTPRTSGRWIRNGGNITLLGV
jgi:uncharacterized protein (DUF697 family)